MLHSAIIHLPHLLTLPTTIAVEITLSAILLFGFVRRAIRSIVQRAFLAGLAAGGCQRIVGSRTGFLAGFAAGMALGEAGRPIVKAVAPLLVPSNRLALTTETT